MRGLSHGTYGGETVTDFKVGDKAKHSTRGNMEITYGPFGGNKYVARDESGAEAYVTATLLSARPAFTAGDKAKMHGESDPVEVLAGPYRNRYIIWYVVRAEVGETTAAEGNLTVIPVDAIKVGDRVRVLVDRANNASVSKGDIFTVRRLVGGGLHTDGRAYGTWFFTLANVEKVTDANAHTLSGVDYDLTAQYRDRDGDAWRFKDVDGEVRGEMHGYTICDDSHTLAYVARTYGPLTKI
jgi:hypothetical protein